MIVGIGIDIVGISRFAGMIERRPGVIDRLFTQRESSHVDGSLRSPASLAARFAAKEAIAKALGAPAGLAWHDCEVLVDQSGRPEVHLRGTVADASSARGIARWHLTMTHDADSAIAQAIAEADAS